MFWTIILSVVSFTFSFILMLRLFPRLLDLIIEKSKGRGFFNGSWKTHLGVGNKDISKIEKAAIAHIGLGGNSKEETVYWNAFFDEDKNDLSTDNDYEILITEAIPVDFSNHGFWSITAYGFDKYLIENKNSNYLIRSSDTNKLVLPYRILLSSNEEDHNENFIALGSKKQKFSLALRCYRPSASVKDQDDWSKIQLPIIRKIK